MKSKRIFLGLAIILPLALLGYFFFRSQEIGDSKIDSASPTSEGLTTDSTEWNIPPLFPNVPWKIPSREESHADFFTIYDTNRNPLKEFTGTEWIFKQNLENGNTTFIPEFIDYYDREAKEKGWNERLFLGNNALNAPAADGPLGSVWGYWKASGNFVRLIGLDYDKHYADFFGDTVNCPCSEELHVFLSNPFPIDKIPFSQ